MQLQRGVKATWWNNIWAQTGAYPPPPLRITPYDGQGTMACKRITRPCSIDWLYERVLNL